jgi:hypothetical protein
MSVSSIPEFANDVPREQFDASPALITTVVKHFEADVRVLLDHISHDYLPPDLVLVVRRLRLIVGEDES